MLIRGSLEPNRCQLLVGLVPVLFPGNKLSCDHEGRRNHPQKTPLLGTQRGNLSHKVSWSGRWFALVRLLEPLASGPLNNHHNNNSQRTSRVTSECCIMNCLKKPAFKVLHGRCLCFYTSPYIFQTWNSGIAVTKHLSSSFVASSVSASSCLFSCSLFHFRFLSGRCFQRASGLHIDF